MGFKVPRRTARVTFEEGHDYYGAEIVLKLDPPLGFMFEFQKLREESPADSIRQFADQVLDSWNLESDDGQPLPANHAGIERVPPAFLNALIERWVAESTAAPAPLGQPSSDTDGSVVPLTQTGT